MWEDCSRTEQLDLWFQGSTACFLVVFRPSTYVAAGKTIMLRSCVCVRETVCDFVRQEVHSWDVITIVFYTDCFCNGTQVCSSRCPKSKKGVVLSQKCLPMDELSALQRESGHSKHTTFHSSSEGEEKGQQRSLYQERGGWRVM